MYIKVKKISETAILPKRGTKDSAGLDLYGANLETISIAPHSTVKIPTDIAIEIPQGYVGAIFARSGLSTNRGLRPANCVGAVDADYRGNVIVALHNDTDEVEHVQPQERIAQLIILPFLNTELIEVDTLEDTDRASGGFGSTGTN